LERGIVVRQGLRFLRAELPRILAMPCNALSPRLVGVIEDLAGDWRRLDERIEGLSSEIEVPGIGPISSAMVAAIGLVTRSRKAATWVTCVELGPFATFPLSPHKRRESGYSRTVVQGQEPVWVRTGKPRTELRTQ